MFCPARGSREVSRLGIVPDVEHLATELEAITDALHGHIMSGERKLGDVSNIDELSAALHRIAIGLSGYRARPAQRANCSKDGKNVVHLNFGSRTPIEPAA